MLSFDKVSLSIQRTSVLKNISFEVVPGEQVAIIGVSGAGKSSIFKLLIGEQKPTLGSIRLDKFKLEELSRSSVQSYRRQIGVVFQDFRLLPKKTVFENIAFALEVCGEEEKIAQKVPELLKLVGLTTHHNRFPHQLSGGEAQRVAIARALVHDPKILIADEPTGNLDPKTSRSIAELFKQLHKDKDLTVIFATHDPIMVEVLRPRVIHLEGGEVAFDEQDCSLERAFENVI